MRRVILVDALNLAFKVFYSCQDLCLSDGRKTGALFSMMRELKLIKEQIKGEIVLVWDGGSSRRKAMFGGYKAKREESDYRKALMGQLPDVKQHIGCLGVQQVEVAGQEADDLIASLAFGRFAEDMVFIVSSDNDFAQLVDDTRVFVVKPGSPLTFFDSEAVEKKFGVRPPKLLLYRIFRGDSSDSIPGVFRLPSAVIVDLVGRYESVEDIYADPAAFTKYTKKQMEGLTAFKSTASLNLALMTLYRDVEIPEFLPIEFQESEARRVFEDFGFASFDMDDFRRTFGPSKGFTKVA